MNLVDLLDENGLQQNEWSLSVPTFGDSGQLTVVGWSGQNRDGKGNKIYIVKCSVCENDPEMFGEGYFKITKPHLDSGKIPCGCSVSTKFSEDQWLVRIQRICSETGFKLKTTGQFQGGKTIAVFSCPLHGETGSKTFKDFCTGSRRCIECRRDNVAKSLKIPDEEYIKIFLSSGVYPEGSTFERSSRIYVHPRYREGSRPYWKFTCGVCQETHERVSGDLKKGKIPCSCGHYKQTVAYIHKVSDGVDLFLKFGITRVGSTRIESLQQGTPFKLDNIGNWLFTSSAACKAAEKEVKCTLKCGVVSKLEFKSGYTETTNIYNLENIIRIYEKHGGVRT